MVEPHKSIPENRRKDYDMTIKTKTGTAGSIKQIEDGQLIEICNVDSITLEILGRKYFITEENGLAGIKSILQVKPEYPEKINIDCNKSCSSICPVSFIRFGVKN